MASTAAPADPRRRDLLQITSGRVDDGTGARYWRVCAGNGRVLGRSAALFADDRAALAHCASVSARVSRLVLIVEHATSASGWRWRLDDPQSGEEARTVSFSARTFDRQGSCRRAGLRMLDSLSALHVG